MLLLSAEATIFNIRSLHNMNNIPSLKIRSFELPYCIIQGGMGAGVSRPRLTRKVFEHGGLGVLSSAGLRDIISIERHKQYSTYDAVREEIETAMDGGYLVGINVMRRLNESYDETIRAAIDAKVSAIFFSAGVPKRIDTRGTAKVLVTSSARFLKLILHFWKDRPDAVVLEGPKAGGHLGFDINDINKPEFSLENLLPEVLEVASKNGNFPVIVAGGIYTRDDILRSIRKGASGVQIGTRFAATNESSASDRFKQAVINSTESDILVVNSSPCDFPFRILTSSPMHKERGIRKPRCNLGYVLEKDSEGRYSVCKAHPNNPKNTEYLCICNGLLSTIGLASDEPALYTVGSNAYRIKKIIPVVELMNELIEG
jgi:nitronate monooxygenase